MSGKKLNNDVETVEGFCNLGSALNTSDGSEMAVAARTRIAWMRFQECGEVLHGRKFLLKMKKKLYQNCVRSILLYENETWCLRKREVSPLRTE